MANKKPNGRKTMKKSKTKMMLLKQMAKDKTKKQQQQQQQQQEEQVQLQLQLQLEQEQQQQQQQVLFFEQIDSFSYENEHFSGSDLDDDDDDENVDYDDEGILLEDLIQMYRDDSDKNPFDGPQSPPPWNRIMGDWGIKEWPTTRRTICDPTSSCEAPHRCGQANDPNATNVSPQSPSLPAPPPPQPAPRRSLPVVRTNTAAVTAASKPNDELFIKTTNLIEAMTGQGKGKPNEMTPIPIPRARQPSTLTKNRDSNDSNTDVDVVGSASSLSLIDVSVEGNGDGGGADAACDLAKNSSGNKKENTIVQPSLNTTIIERNTNKRKRVSESSNDTETETETENERKGSCGAKKNKYMTQQQEQQQQDQQLGSSSSSSSLSSSVDSSQMAGSKMGTDVDADTDAITKAAASVGNDDDDGTGRSSNSPPWRLRMSRLMVDTPMETIWKHLVSLGVKFRSLQLLIHPVTKEPQGIVEANIDVANLDTCARLMNESKIGIQRVIVTLLPPHPHKHQHHHQQQQQQQQPKDQEQQQQQESQQESQSESQQHQQQQPKEDEHQQQQQEQQISAASSIRPQDSVRIAGPNPKRQKQQQDEGHSQLKNQRKQQQQQEQQFSAASSIRPQDSVRIAGPNPNANANPKSNISSRRPPWRLRITKIIESTPISEIREALTSMGIEFRSLRQLKHFKTKAWLGIFEAAIDGDRREQCKQLVNGDGMVCGQKAHISLLPPLPDAIRCYKCLRFGHIQHKCANLVRCLKCAMNHATNACNKPTNAAPRCANCDGKHVASYKGCPVYREARRTLLAQHFKRIRAKAVKDGQRQRQQRQQPRPAAGEARNGSKFRGGSHNNNNNYNVGGQNRHRRWAAAKNEGLNKREWPARSRAAASYGWSSGSNRYRNNNNNNNDGRIPSQDDGRQRRQILQHQHRPQYRPQHRPQQQQQKWSRSQNNKNDSEYSKNGRWRQNREMASANGRTVGRNGHINKYNNSSSSKNNNNNDKNDNNGHKPTGNVGRRQ